MASMWRIQMFSWHTPSLCWIRWLQLRQVCQLCNWHDNRWYQVPARRVTFHGQDWRHGDVFVRYDMGRYDTRSLDVEATHTQMPNFQNATARENRLWLHRLLSRSTEWWICCEKSWLVYTEPHWRLRLNISRCALEAEYCRRRDYCAWSFKDWPFIWEWQVSGWIETQMLQECSTSRRTRRWCVTNRGRTLVRGAVNDLVGSTTKNVVESDFM